MDQDNFLFEVMTKIISQIKRVVIVVLVLTGSNDFSVAETTNKPSLSTVSPPLETSQPKINLSITTVSACLLAAFLFVSLFFIYFRHYANRQLALAAATTGYGGGGDRSSTQLAAACGLDPAVIATFTTFSYSTVKDIKIGEQVLECAVCLNEFHDHEALRLLPECRHVFHRGCIDEWLALHVTCPVCRTSLVPKPGQLGCETELPFGSNRRITKDHVSVEMLMLFQLKHNDIPASTKLSRSCSVRHPMEERNVENSTDRYMLRLPEDVRNKVDDINVSLDIAESSLKKCVKSASAKFIRGSNYFDYERFL